MYWLIGVALFVFLIGIYIYFRISSRTHIESRRVDSRDTNAAKLFNSKVKDAAFFDGESEDYAEAQSRLRQYSGG